MNSVTQVERGWPGHHILATRALFRRNTLLECKETKVVVSTIGLIRSRQVSSGFETLDNAGSFFETKVFHCRKDDSRYRDADFNREIKFQAYGVPSHEPLDFTVKEVDADDKANQMHDSVVCMIRNLIPHIALDEQIVLIEWHDDWNDPRSDMQAPQEQRSDPVDA